MSEREDASKAWDDAFGRLPPDEQQRALDNLVVIGSAGIHIDKHGNVRVATLEEMQRDYRDDTSNSLTEKK